MDPQLSGRCGACVFCEICQTKSHICICARVYTLVVMQAKSAGVPKANIDNILKKASAKDSADYKESVFEVSNFVLFVCT